MPGLPQPGEGGDGGLPAVHAALLPAGAAQDLLQASTQCTLAPGPRQVKPAGELSDPNPLMAVPPAPARCTPGCTVPPPARMAPSTPAWLPAQAPGLAAAQASWLVATVQTSHATWGLAPCPVPDEGDIIILFLI